MDIHKPFLKWIGGKTQILNEIINILPTEINNYHELFLGGGSVLFAILSLQKNNKINIKNKIYAYDFNKNLINVYKTIQTHKNLLYKKLNKYIEKYNNFVDIKDKEKYYYDLRKKYNKQTDDIIKISSLFIFLNKTCFRGMYRENKKKEFNVPFGNYKKINIFNKIELDNIYELIKNVEFINLNFIESIKKPVLGDFVYLDPPYVCLNKTSFVNYTNEGFDINTHNLLFDNILELHNKNIKFILSNSNTEMVLNKFNINNIVIKPVLAKRAINSKNPGSKVIELLIKND
jgi:DNA adenine methylase